MADVFSLNIYLLCWSSITLRPRILLFSMIFKYIRTENAETVCWIISSECLLNSNQQQQEPWWRWTWTSPPMCMIKIVLLVNSDNRLLLSNEMIRLTFDWKAGTHVNLAKNVYSLATSENKHTSRLCYSMARWWKNKQVFPLLFSAKCLRDIQSAFAFRGSPIDGETANRRRRQHISANNRIDALRRARVTVNSPVPRNRSGLIILGIGVEIRPGRPKTEISNKI